MTGAFSLAGSTGGTPLYSALGDIGGFGHTTLTFSPEQGSFGGGTVTSVDYAGLAPNDMVAVTAAGNGLYSTNGGTSVTSFASTPPGILNYNSWSDGTVALSANDQTMVWAPSNEGPYYSGNNGASWTATNLIASVTSITQTGGVPKVVTSAANNFAVGQYVTISGATNSGSDPTAYDGTYVIASIINSTTFTYTDSNVTSSTTSPATGTITAGLNGTILSDKVNPNYFYYWSENETWNGFTLYISTNGGQTFSPSAGGTIRTGQIQVAVNATVAGQIWISTYIGLYESTNFGASFNHLGSWSNNFQALALGAPAPGSSYPSIYAWGTPAGDSFQGIYRSDDGGNSWLQVDDVNHQYSGYPLVMAADPNVFGRFYISSGGIIAGNPATSLPNGWSDTDINEPGNYGWATNSTTLSTGATVNQWNVVGGGAGFSSSPISISSLSRTGGVATAITTTACGLQVGQTIRISGASNSVYDGTFVVTGLYDTVAGLNNDIGAATEFTFAIASGTDTASGTITATLDDQFNFAYEPVTGSASVAAQLTALTNADNGNGTPQAGVMVRAATGASDPFFEIAQSSAGNLVLEYRTTTGGSVTTQTLGGVPIGSEYLEVTRSGNNFGAWYGTNGTSWTQLGSTVAIAAMPAAANFGIAATASYNPQLTDATFASVSVIASGPTVQTPAAANPNPVTGTSTALSVLGAENGSDTGLTYTWSYTGPTGVTYSGNTNGTNAAKNITAVFTQAGSYNFTATITDPNNISVTSSVNVVVQQTPTTITVLPATSPVLPIGFSQQFSASATDQFGDAISSPTFSWGVTGNGNSIDNTGNVTLGSTPGSFTVSATDGAQGSATIIAENFAIPSASTLDINLGSAGAVSISQSGSNLTASQNGVQITLSGFTGVTVTDTASSDVLNFNGPVALPFSFVNCGTSTVNVNSGTLTFAAVMGGTIDLGTLFVANGAAAIITAATTQNPTTLDLNSLSIAPNGVLDVTNNEMLIAYGASDPITTIAGYLKSGYDRNGWDGKGIISSMAQTLTDGLRYALGYADGNDGIVSGLASGQIEVKYTLSGDANLDGLVNGSDFNVLSANFNQSITGWDQGDFNYDGLVNASDFNDLSANFNQGVNIAAVANTILAAAPAATTSTPAKTPAAAPVAVSPTSIQTTSTIPASESDDVVDTVLGKHVATKKPRHGGRR
jgi:hypothetical protein